MAGDDNADRWRKKYLDVLDELERKEVQWKDTEAFLRQAVTRVSLAADQSDATLSKALDRLRDSVRAGAKLDRLKHDLEVVSLAIVELDKQRAGKPKLPSRFEILSSLLDGLEVPKGLGRQARELDKRLAGFEPEADPAEAVQLLKAFLSQWIDWEREQAATSGGDKAGEKKAGWLARLRGGDAAREDEPAREPPTQELASAAVKPHSEAELASFMGTKLAGWLARLKVDEALDQGRRRLMTHAHRLDSSKAVEALLAELGDWVLTPRSEPPTAGGEGEPTKGEVPADAEGPTPEPAVAAPASASIPHYEVLIQLVQRLDFPGIMAGDVERAVEVLSACPDDADLPNSLRLVADLIARARSIVQDEKREFEEFLSQLTSRLKEFEDELGISETNREDTREQREALDAALAGEVRGLQDSIQGAVSLEKLKSDIQGRLDTLEVHLEAKRRLETKRNEQVKGEIQRLTERMQRMEEEAEVLRINLEQQRERAYRDALTELPNRLAWDERLASEFSRWKRYGRPLVLAVLDIDFFKRINDSFGHKAGDKLLRLVAKIVAKSTRESDFLARYGGEEFALLMPETELQGAQIVAEKLRAAVENCGAHFNQQKVPVTISIGLTAFTEADSPETAFERADQALYRSKEGGRNRCTVL